MGVMAGSVGEARCMSLHQNVGVQNALQQRGGGSLSATQVRLNPGCVLKSNNDCRQSIKCSLVPLRSSLDGANALQLSRRELCQSTSAPYDAPRSQRRGCQAAQAEAQPVQEAALPGPWFSPRLDRSDETATPCSPFASLEMPKPRWKRVLLKISGEALAGDKNSNVDPAIVMRIAQEVAAIARLGVEVAVTVGGGNFFRGATWAGASGLDRASADQIGMMATVMNAIFLQASLESLGCPTRVQTAFKMAEVAEPYIRRRAMRHLEKGRVVIFGAGTGNPFFTTDTAAALRAAEINAEVVLKATNVDGVYDCDPRHNAGARLHDHVSYAQVARDRLSVMDATAITLCAENDIPVVVFNLNVPGNITRALTGERIGTLIDQEGSEQSA